jgi:hypothetical protein
MTGDEYKHSQVLRPSVIRTIKKAGNIQSSVDHCAHAVIETVEGWLVTAAI